jgi:hypothetical protein
VNANESEIRAEVREFESVIENALIQKYAGTDPEWMRHLMTMLPVRRWDLIAFHDAYVRAGKFPAERLASTMRYLFDIKIELYFITEVDLGLNNRLVWDRGYDHKNPLATPHLLLTRLSLDQTLIAKSRILWERIMTCVCHLATGDTLEAKKSKSRSKRTVFFEFVAAAAEWRWLEAYKGELQKYEDDFRTPEFHKNSFLRAELMGKYPERDLNEFSILLNRAMNCVWDNLLSIVSGGKARIFTDIHMTADGGVDEQYRS